MRRAPAGGWGVRILATWLSVAGIACVSPNLVIRVDDSDAGTQTGTGGSPAGSAGGISGGGAGGKTVTTGAGGAGAGVGSGAGGSAAAAGGRTGSGGTTGAGGTVIGPTASFMDDFETPNVGARWIWDAPNMVALRPSADAASVCGAWAAAVDTAPNHSFQETATCSDTTWAASGNTAWTDMRLQAKVMFPAGATATTIVSLGIRFLDDRSQYFIEFSNDGKLKIRAKVEAGGASADISNASKARVPVPAGQWVTIAFAVSGTTASVYLGDDPTAPAALTGPVSGLTHGGIAIGVQGGPVSFDDIVVTPP